jgi:hypothetical protein
MLVDEEPVVANPEEAEALKLQIEKVSAATVQGAAAAVAAATLTALTCRFHVVKSPGRVRHQRLQHAFPCSGCCTLMLYCKAATWCRRQVCYVHLAAPLCLLGHIQIVHGLGVSGLSCCCASVQWLLHSLAAPHCSSSCCSPRTSTKWAMTAAAG